ncbi:MAG: histidine kinase [Thermoleophilia bacterium]
MSRPGRAALHEAVVEVVALVAGAPSLGAAGDDTLERALGLVAEALGAPAVALYVREPAAGNLLRRGAARRGVGAELPALAADPAAAELAGATVVTARAGGQTVGALAVAARGAELDEAELAAARAAAHALALGLRNAQLFDGLRERARELDRQVRQLVALTEVARDVARSLDEAEVHRTIAAQARRLVRAEAAVLLRGAGDGLTVAAWDGPDGEASLPRAERLGQVAGAGPGVRLGREMAVPVPRPDGADGDPAGVIALFRAGGDPFDDDDLERLRGLADQATVALANARLLADLRREQQERRALAAALVQAQENERRRVAEDLHDGPVQDLVGLGLMLDALSTDLRPSTEEIAGEVDRAAAAARDAVRTLRRAIGDLHPVALEEMGFQAATRALVRRLEWQGVDVELDLAAADGLSDMHRTVAFRIVQEAVANIARHAEPSRVSIRARREGGRVVLDVADDGRGFDLARPRPGVAEGHLGLEAAKERAALAGGEVTITSAEGDGTLLRLDLPGAGAAPVEDQPGESRSSAAASAASSAKRSSTTT